jgi:hypothetical protein
MISNDGAARYAQFVDLESRPSKAAIDPKSRAMLNGRRV